MIFTSFIAGCNSTATMLAKKWRPVAINEPLSDSLKNELFAKTIIEFTKDGRYTIDGLQRNDTGTYSLSDNGKTLTVTSRVKSKVTEISIDTITNDKIVFTTKADGSRMTAVSVK